MCVSYVHYLISPLGTILKHAAHYALDVSRQRFEIEHHVRVLAHFPVDIVELHMSCVGRWSHVHE